MAHTNDRAGLAIPLTLAIDIGGSHLKAAVLNASGKMSTVPVRVKTPKLASRVRRQSFWDKERLKLRESLARLV
jgi:hypothetical protein